ncbi:MAG: hypothetical protein FD177_2536 [Desulfovibrionaceae bacterium]|nr:MAG: hypothetical protein FD177_2536 [Desulfovibrionaceae bacterium]
MMICPHCQGHVQPHRPVSKPGHYKLYGHHGEMVLDAQMLKAMAAHAEAHLQNRREIAETLEALRFYREVVERMEFESAFAHHVLSYDGEGGTRFFPGATKRAKLAALKARIAAGQVRENDLQHYLELMWRE